MYFQFSFAVEMIRSQIRISILVAGFGYCAAGSLTNQLRAGPRARCLAVVYIAKNRHTGTVVYSASKEKPRRLPHRGITSLYKVRVRSQRLAPVCYFYLIARTCNRQQPIPRSDPGNRISRDCSRWPCKVAWDEGDRCFARK